MLKEQKKNNLIIVNALDLGEDVNSEGNGKGRKFTSRFIEAGVAHYEQFGDVLITKETLDKFIQTMVGCPVIIKHKDITDKNADKERVGVVSRVWYNEADGWFYCEGVIWDKQAIDLVKNQGWNVSCTYDFESDFKKSTYHGKEIDMEFTGGEFLHLALVPNPRYERATIAFNSQDDTETVFLSGLKTIIENALDTELSDEDKTVLNGIAEIFEGENGLGELVNNSFPDHAGRPGKVGGSLPKENKGLSIEEKLKNIKPIKIEKSKVLESTSKKDISKWVKDIFEELGEIEILDTNHLIKLSKESADRETIKRRVKKEHNKAPYAEFQEIVSKSIKTSDRDKDERHNRNQEIYYNEFEYDNKFYGLDLIVDKPFEKDKYYRYAGHKAYEIAPRDTTGV